MWEYVKVWVPILLLIAAGFVLAGRFVSPLPPRELTLAAAGAGGAYDAFARRYRNELAQEGIALKIVNTRGTVENLAMLAADPRKADLALIQGGVASAAEFPMVESLGSMFYEPVFVFARRGDGTDRLRDLAQRRIAVGLEGSGNRVLALKLLAANGFDPAALNLLPLGGSEARDALLAGEIDAAIFVLAYPLPSLEALFRAPHIRLVSFERVEAYRMFFPYLSAVTLPAGSVSLADGLPAEDVALLAPAASLVVHEDLHPALKNLLVRVAHDVHSSRQLFSPAGRFPSTELTDFPLNSYARRFTEGGSSIFARWLPFWVAVWGERLLILLLPLLGLMLPLMRIAPPIYRWQVQRKIYRWYKDLALIEADARGIGGEPDTARLARRLEELEARIEAVKVPLSYRQQLYHLRQHVALVRQRLAA